MIQLVFPAGTPRRRSRPSRSRSATASTRAPSGRSGDDKLELVDGTHPVVYPAAGSHANFYSDGLFLGRSAEQGVGCDDTTGPSVELRPAGVRSRASPRREAAFPWIAFEGRWGERQQAFYNGPRDRERQWTEPITWSRTGGT